MSDQDQIHSRYTSEQRYNAGINEYDNLATAEDKINQHLANQRRSNTSITSGTSPETAASGGIVGILVYGIILGIIHTPKHFKAATGIHPFILIPFIIVISLLSYHYAGTTTNHGYAYQSISGRKHLESNPDKLSEFDTNRTFFGKSATPMNYDKSLEKLKKYFGNAISDKDLEQFAYGSVSISSMREAAFKNKKADIFDKDMVDYLSNEFGVPYTYKSRIIKEDNSQYLRVHYYQERSGN